MNKTIKIIDLINKIANGEEFPKKIKCNKKDIYIWDSIQNKYALKDASYISLAFDFKELNEEVEIIEDEDTIDIQDIVMLDLEKYGFDIKDEFAIDLTCKINELISAIKQIDKKNHGIK